jgi:hypothetical protein
MGFVQKVETRVCVKAGRKDVIRGRMAIQVQMWINLKTEGGIRRSTDVSKCVSCHSACQITLYIAVRLHELVVRHWQSLFAGLRTSLEKASSSFVGSVRIVCLSTLVEIGSRWTGLREKIIVGSCTEMFLHLPISVKFGHEWHALYIKTCEHLWPLWLLTLPWLPVFLRLLCSP